MHTVSSRNSYYNNIIYNKDNNRFAAHMVESKTKLYSLVNACIHLYQEL